LIGIGSRSIGGFEVSGPAVVWASATLLGVSLLAAIAHAPSRAQFARSVVVVVEALVDGAKNALPVALACASAGIIIGIIALTGIGISFTQLVLALAQETLLLALVVTAMAGIILGMGMPTTPAYIIMVALLVPAVARLLEPSYAALGLEGVQRVAPAHMFAFYFAILSAITPPVALAVFAAASLAKSDLWKTGWAAMRIGAAGFIVPFMFAYEPALMLIVKPGQWHEAILAALSASIGCVALASGLYGYFLRPCAWWQRVLLVGGAFLLIKPGWITDAIGFGVLAMVALVQLAESRRAIAPSASSPSS
jgi:TRAP transporter 4TM/12TM fusion protein